MFLVLLGIGIRAWKSNKAVGFSTKETIKIIIRDNPDTVMAFDIMDEDKLIGFVLVHRFWLKGIEYGRIPYSDRGG